MKNALRINAKFIYYNGYTTSECVCVCVYSVHMCIFEGGFVYVAKVADCIHI